MSWRAYPLASASFGLASVVGENTKQRLTKRGRPGKAKNLTLLELMNWHAYSLTSASFDLAAVVGENTKQRLLKRERP
ncbi:MAG: hypothetical protein H7Y01_00345 [Ferruginibacter sp.]|nr:hypothetical protein [Chitinophagaceae bacterium]